MSDKDEQRKQGEQDETPDVEGHFRSKRAEDESDDETPDVEGHFKSKAPAREHAKRRF